MGNLFKSRMGEKKRRGMHRAERLLGKGGEEGGRKVKGEKETKHEEIRRKLKQKQIK